MKWRGIVLFALAGFAAVLFLTGKAEAAPGDVFYEDDFESYYVGEHPSLWGEMSGFPDDVVTDEWAASGEKSFVSVSASGGLLKHPAVSVIDVGAWPLPDYFAYEATLHMEATSGSSGMVGFMFADPRYAGHVPAENAVAFRLDGQIMWYGPISSSLGTWTPGTDQTFTVRVEINFPLLAANVWIDGVPVGTGLPAWPKTIPAASVYGAAVPLDKWGFGVAHAFAANGPGRVFIDDITLSECEGEACIAADVKVRPKTLNLKSNGRFVTAYIELPSGYDAHNIDITTVTLSAEGSAPIHALRWPTSVRDRDCDGLYELMVKFLRSEVQAVLEPTQSATVTVSGELFDLTCFTGSDHIRVIRPGKVKSNNGNHYGHGNGNGQ